MYGYMVLHTRLMDDKCYWMIPVGYWIIKIGY